MIPKVNRWKIGLISGAVVVGAGYIILKTFPHIFAKEEDDDDSDNVVVHREVDENPNKPIELFESEEAFQKN